MGDKYLIEVKLPALITVTKDINTPRLPTLRNVLKAKKATIEVWNANDLAGYGEVCRFGLQGSMTTVFKIVFPSEGTRKGLIFHGDDAVEKLVEVLRERGVLRLESTD
jgi:electron transfer flavoprotein beta subunit